TFINDFKTYIKKGSQQNNQPFSQRLGKIIARLRLRLTNWMLKLSFRLSSYAAHMFLESAQSYVLYMMRSLNHK
ncbi:MAG: hypothetical protein IKA36_02865, partial [Clostridia bacterium]|nr:hypothetical protein [Clostridia bacterium]